MIPTRVPLVLALAAAAVLSGTVTTGGQAARPGDAGRFDTWVGYDVGRYPVAGVHDHRYC